MSSLEKCADSLLQQKAVQNSNHEHLERQILDLERGRRTSLVALRGLMASVQRRSSDLVDIANANRLHDEQLAQDKLKLSALTMAITEDRKHQEHAQARLRALSDAWMGQPTRIVQVVRALQERSAVVKEASAMAAALCTARSVVRCVGQASRVREWASGRLVLQKAHQRACHEGVAQRVAEAQESLSHARAVVLGAHQKRAEVDGLVRARETHLASCQASQTLAAAYGEMLSQLAAQCRLVIAAATDDADASAQCLERCQEEHRSATEQLHTALEESARAAAAQQAQIASYEAERASLLTDEQRSRAAADTARSQCAKVRQLLAEQQSHLRTAARQAWAAAYALLLARHMRMRLDTAAAARTSALAETTAALGRLRAQHDEHLTRQRVGRLQQRLRDAVAELEVEESLTRRLDVVAKEADSRQLLRERCRMALDECRGREVNAAAARMAMKVQGEKALRRRRTAAKRARRTTGTLPSNSDREGSPPNMATLAEELGLGAAMGPAAQGKRSTAAAPRRTYPPSGSNSSSTRCRVAALFPSVHKPPSACAQAGQGGDADGTTTTTPRKPRGELSALSSPSPRRPAALPGSTVAGDRRPLRRPLAAAPFASFGFFTQPQASPQQQQQQQQRQAPPSGRAPLKPMAVRAAQRADLLGDAGEDLFADHFT